MKIGIISDTHIPAKTPELDSELIDVLKGCDLILHAGDLTEECVFESLKKISKVEAVCGNMDSSKVRSRLDSKKVLKIGGKKICLMHGRGNPNKIIDLLKKEFFKEKPNIIVFGHSHIPMNKYIDGVLFFNPGSATDTIFAPYRSYGIIEIQGGKIESNIHKLHGVKNG